jgi:hypothetical protein
VLCCASQLLCSCQSTLVASTQRITCTTGDSGGGTCTLAPNPPLCMCEGGRGGGYGKGQLSSPEPEQSQQRGCPLHMLPHAVGGTINRPKCRVTGSIDCQLPQCYVTLVWGSIAWACGAADRHCLFNIVKMRCKAAFLVVLLGLAASGCLAADQLLRAQHEQELLHAQVRPFFLEPVWPGIMPIPQRC